MKLGAVRVILAPLIATCAVAFASSCYEDDAKPLTTTEEAHTPTPPAVVISNTETPTPNPLPSANPQPISTPTTNIESATSTSEPPSATPTSEPPSTTPTDTAVPPPTDTPMPTNTPTITPTHTDTATPTNTPTPTSTIAPATFTPTHSPTAVKPTVAYTPAPAPIAPTPTLTPTTAKPTDTPSDSVFIDNDDCSSNIQKQTLPQIEIQLTTTSGETFLINAEVADMPQERQQGLMCRNHIPDGNGMLFIFEAPTHLRFWMFNTYIPLDIIYIDSSMKPINALSMVPCPRPNGLEDNARWSDTCSAQSVDYRSAQPAQYALELPAGWLQQIGINLQEIHNVKFDW